jgi:predicted MFS family arabinose efflux permease
MCLGNGAGSLIPVGVMVTRVFPARMGIANAVVMAGMSVGQLVMIAVLTAALVATSWRSVYLSLGLAHLALLPFLIAVPRSTAAQQQSVQPSEDLRVLSATRTRQFWLLIAVYAICGFDDFFVTTHVVAFAQDRGVDAFLAGNLLALMGLTGLIGVVGGGALSDRSGPAWPTTLSFVARVFVFGLLMVDQSATSVAVFALVFGTTFLVTAPLVVVFVSESFGQRHLGALTGLITMVHHICGGIGAYFGAAVFDVTRSYDGAFLTVLILSLLAFVLSMLLARPRDALRTA